MDNTDRAGTFENWETTTAKVRGNAEKFGKPRSTK
jgi:hypothetical protein